MYIPEHFAEPRIEVLHRILIEKIHSEFFSHMAGSASMPITSPFIWIGREARAGFCEHMLRGATRSGKTLALGKRCSSVFQAGDAYIAPGWYPSEA